MELTEEEIREILDLIDKSNFGLFELETRSLKLSVAKHGYKTTPAAQPTAPSAPQGAPAQPTATAETDTTLGLIEVMKVFTAVTAGTAGVVSKILIGDGQSVEYGQVLFGIDPAR